MWRQNDVIDHNEYLLFTFSESTAYVYSLQFMFSRCEKLTNVVSADVLVAYVLATQRDN